MAFGKITAFVENHGSTSFLWFSTVPTHEHLFSQNGCLPQPQNLHGTFVQNISRVATNNRLYSCINALSNPSTTYPTFTHQTETVPYKLSDSTVGHPPTTQACCIS